MCLRTLSMKLSKKVVLRQARQMGSHRGSLSSTTRIGSKVFQMKARRILYPKGIPSQPERIEPQILKIIEISKRENRIILTKSRKLLKFKEVTHAIYIRPGTTAEQIIRVINYLDI
jgi:hypothetical protein